MDRTLTFLMTALMIFTLSGFTQSELNYGTAVQVTVNSYTCSENDDIATGHLAADILTSDGKVAAKAGTEVMIDVDRESRRSIGKPGWVRLAFKSTQSVDGQQILLSGSKRFEGEDARRKTLGVGIGVGLFVWPMFAYLAKQGGAAEIEANTIVGGIVVAGSYEIR